MLTLIIVVIMPTIFVSDETHTELKKIKGLLLAKDGRERTFDEVIAKLLDHWKKTYEK